MENLLFLGVPIFQHITVVITVKILKVRAPEIITTNAELQIRGGI